MSEYDIMHKAIYDLELRLAAAIRQISKDYKNAKRLKNENKQLQKQIEQLSDEIGLIKRANVNLRRENETLTALVEINQKRMLDSLKFNTPGTGE